MLNPPAPVSLIHQGRLAIYDIYKTAKLNERESVLVKGREDPIQPNRPFDGAGLLPNCDKSLANGDKISDDQWNTLQLWHAGLSCQLLLKPNQGVLFDIENPDFLTEFEDRSRRQNVNNATNDRIFLCYQLRRGTQIPPIIGIEQDGANHVCLYPIGNDIPISDIEAGLAKFTIDHLLPLQNSWRPYAIFQVRGSGFNWPLNFPPDSDLFPFRRWITTVVSYGESDIAVSASMHTEEFVIGKLALFEYFSKMLSIARSFALGCQFDNIEMNVCILKALRFALNANLLFKEHQR
jgi:hypothetical protein